MTRTAFAIALVIICFAPGAAPGAEQLDRLFFTPEQRQQLDVARAQRSRATLQAEIEEQTPLPEILTYHGIVRRSDGRNTVWINDRTIDDGSESRRIPAPKPRADGSISLELPQSDRTVNLKVGQSVEMLSGTVAEPYARRPAPPKPAAKPAADTSAAREAVTGLATAPTPPVTAPASGSDVRDPRPARPGPTAEQEREASRARSAAGNRAQSGPAAGTAPR